MTRGAFADILQPTVQQFIRDHEHDDPYHLALQAHRYPGYPIPAIAEQIQARQKAKQKLPEWYATPDIVFPPLRSMEQCSSQITAQFKRDLVGGQRLVDLTGGAGVDTYYLSQSFRDTDYVEQSQELASIAQHNFSALGASNIEVHATSAEAFLGDLSTQVDCIYLDPARRDEHNRRVFQLADSRPDVLTLYSTLLAKAHSVLIKTAPLLDIQATVRDLAGVTCVYVVAADNEVKEVLYQLEATKKSDPVVTAVNLQTHRGEDHFSFSYAQEAQAEAMYADPLTYLYEPNAALLKAGAFKLVAQRFGLFKLHPNTHLYTSKQLVTNFPGRTFQCRAIVPYQKKAVRSRLAESKANVTTRNFPDSVTVIRKKLGIKDGGDTYLFATCLVQERLVILITSKVT